MLAVEAMALRFALARMHALTTAIIESRVSDTSVARPRLRAQLTKVAVPVHCQHWQTSPPTCPQESQERASWIRAFNESSDAFRLSVAKRNRSA